MQSVFTVIIWEWSNINAGAPYSELDWILSLEVIVWDLATAQGKRTTTASKTYLVSTALMLASVNKCVCATEKIQ